MDGTAKITTIEGLAAAVIASGLVPPNLVEVARAELPVGPAAEAPARLARLLIRRGLLTDYQASKLLMGVSRGFFLGGFRVLKPIGEGGMGKVYLARRESNGAKVALKVLPPRKQLESTHALARFHREIDLSKRVMHPNVARTLEAGEQDGVPFMAMELVPGSSLHDLIKARDDRPLRVPVAARYFIEALAGLQAAHDAGLVHRDVKPSNLMVTPDGHAKLLDLGLARALGDEQPLTRADAVLGTLDYASPEQLTDASSADARSDLYSLGCALYFALSGRPPFAGGDAINKIFKQRLEDPPPLEKIAPGVPAAFAAIVRKLMAKSPADRYASASEASRDLGRWANPEVSEALTLLGSEAARSFRPPPADLDDDSETSEGGPPQDLRELGPAEPDPPRIRRAPRQPAPAVVTQVDQRAELDAIARLRPPPAPPGEGTWLLGFVAMLVVLGALAVVFYALIR